MARKVGLGMARDWLGMQGRLGVALVGSGVVGQVGRGEIRRGWSGGEGSGRLGAAGVVKRVGTAWMAQVNTGWPGTAGQELVGHGTAGRGAARLVNRGETAGQGKSGGLARQDKGSQSDLARAWRARSGRARLEMDGASRGVVGAGGARDGWERCGWGRQVESLIAFEG